MTQGLQRVMDIHMSRLFGDSFHPVLNHELSSKIGCDLLTGLSNHPDRTMEVLAGLFKGEEKAALVLSALGHALKGSAPGEDRDRLLSILTAAGAGRRLRTCFR